LNYQVVVEVLVMLMLTLDVHQIGQVGRHQQQVNLVHVVDTVVKDLYWLVLVVGQQELLIGN
tara:strand:- start:449 stop:634 length:186 start_codon:yes stop_codon:yes gene_type:complete